VEGISVGLLGGRFRERKVKDAARQKVRFVESHLVSGKFG